MFAHYEHIKTWKRNGFRLELFDTRKRDSYGKSILAYTFHDRRELIFSGEDFHVSPCHAIDSKETVYALLSFLSLQKGDTDREYFDAYTPRQLAWAESLRAEELKFLIPDGY